MARAKKATVGKYLVKRLEQAGLKHIFDVPGDYVLDFFDCLEESNIEIVGTCNELNAGYAADAYARVNGVGGVCITYGVGGFSLFNVVVGAIAESVPFTAKIFESSLDSARRSVRTSHSAPDHYYPSFPSHFANSPRISKSTFIMEPPSSPGKC